MRKAVIWFVIGVSVIIDGGALYYHAWPALALGLLVTGLGVYGLIKDWEQ